MIVACVPVRVPCATKEALMNVQRRTVRAQKDEPSKPMNVPYALHDEMQGSWITEELSHEEP